jgi:hypothetical protein
MGNDRAQAEREPGLGDAAHVPVGFLPQDHGHAVQLYDDESFLLDSVGDFLASGLAAGQPLIVIATAPHQHAFCDRLSSRSFDVARAQAAGQLTLLDAHETLEEIMVGKAPDPELFQRVVGGALAKIGAAWPGRLIGAYGEMVDLLCREGNWQAAIRLEELWNDLSREHSFALLCAYVMTSFPSAEDGDRLRKV